MRYYLAILFCWFSVFAFGQDGLAVKVVSGDTLFWNYDIELLEAINGKDLLESTDEFNFRFKTQGRIIELTRNNGHLSGRLINFVYQSRPNSDEEEKLLHEVIELNKDELEKLYEMINMPSFRELPSDNEIEGWRNGFDGITYCFEYADTLNYSRKSFWTPSIQDSIPESLIVLEVVDSLESLLHLDSLQEAFMSRLPAGFTYRNGGLMMYIVRNSSSRIGYSGATKLPYGLNYGFHIRKALEFPLNFGIYGDLRSNFEGSWDFEFNFQKYGLSYGKNVKEFNLEYGYRYRNYEFNGFNNPFNTHHFLIRTQLGKSMFHPFTGLVYQIGLTDKWGARLGGAYSFLKPGLGIYAESTLFKDEVNLRVSLSKSITIKRIPSFRLSVGYEKFQSYHDAMLYVLFRL